MLLKFIKLGNSLRFDSRAVYCKIPSLQNCVKPKAGKVTAKSLLPTI